MKKRFYQLEVTIRESKENHHVVLINRFKELESMERFLEGLEEETSSR